MARLRILTIAVLLLAIVPYGARVYLDRLRFAASLRHLSMSERKEALFAPWYAEVNALRRRIPADRTIDFVMAKPSARDIAVLAGAELQPRDVRFFDGWDAWRARERAKFLHDDRAVNAPPGPPPQPADVVVLVDPDAKPQFRVVPQ